MPVTSRIEVRDKTRWSFAITLLVRAEALQPSGREASAHGAEPPQAARRDELAGLPAHTQHSDHLKRPAVAVGN